MKISAVVSSGLLVAGALAVSQGALAQRRPPGPPHGPPPAAEQAAPIDLTGYWASIITEDWRWRMLTAPRGDFPGIRLTPAGRALAMKFDPTKYGGPFTENIDCRAYYAGGVMRMPTDVHISWAGPNVLRIQTDFGEQTRMFYFKKADMPHGPPSGQGDSFAAWVNMFPFKPAGGGFGAGNRLLAAKGGILKVETNNLLPGWIRRNGVPYSSKAQVIEYYQTYHDPTGKKWFDVTTEVRDPVYLAMPFITNSDFRQLPNGSSWSPHPCVNMSGG